MHGARPSRRRGAAALDRLPDGHTNLLQVAAVIGRDVDGPGSCVPQPESRTPSTTSSRRSAHRFLTRRWATARGSSGSCTRSSASCYRRDHDAAGGTAESADGGRTRGSRPEGCRTPTSRSSPSICTGTFVGGGIPAAVALQRAAAGVAIRRSAYRAAEDRCRGPACSSRRKAFLIRTQRRARCARRAVLRSTGRGMWPRCGAVTWPPYLRWEAAAGNRPVEAEVPGTLALGGVGRCRQGLRFSSVLSQLADEVTPTGRLTRAAGAWRGGPATPRRKRRCPQRLRSSRCGCPELAVWVTPVRKSANVTLA